MNTKKLTLPLVALMLAMAALTAPVQADKPTGPNVAATCSGETTQDGVNNDDGDLIFCQVIAGPGGIQHKSILSLGLAICHLLQPNTPLACGNTAGSVAGAGGAIYDVNDATAGTHQLTAWVKQSSGLCGVGGIGCGFDINLCNDVDLDGTCTNINDNSDQFQHAQSNEPILGGGFIIPAIGDLPCVPIVTCPDNPVIPTPGGVCNDDGDGNSEHDKGDDKDTKNCGTDDDAGVSFCGKPAEEEVESDDWSDGQVVVFIGAWIDTWIGWYGFGGDDDGDEGDDDFPTNIGAGLSIGTFDAWLVVGDSCTLPECDDDQDNAPANGATDFPDDPGCDSWKDPDEAPPPGATECNDGIDNDGNGLSDETDPGCWTDPNDPTTYDPNDNDESGGVEPRVCYASALRNRWAPLGQQWVIDTNCPFATCQTQEPNAATRVVECVAENACKKDNVLVYAQLERGRRRPLPRASVTTDLLCEDPEVVIATATDITPNRLPGTGRWDDGVKTTDDYVCRFTFNGHVEARTRLYEAFGFCADLGPADNDDPQGCQNLVDDDQDGLPDAADPDCWDGGFGTGTYDPNNVESNDDTPNLPACADGEDNDDDGFVDYPEDTGCGGPTDTDESGGGSFFPECSDGIDNDDNGVADYPQDTGCDSPTDTSESSGGDVLGTCADGEDNDNDDFADEEDADCWDAAFPNGVYDPLADESGSAGSYLPACSNGADDDEDDFTDFPADPDCTGPNDPAE